MLSVWWNWKGVVHFELLGRNETINSDVYCRQLCYSFGRYILFSAYIYPLFSTMNGYKILSKLLILGGYLNYVKGPRPLHSFLYHGCITDLYVILNFQRSQCSQLSL